MSYQETIYRAKKSGEEIGEDRGTIKGTIKTYFKFGKTAEETLADIIDEFSLTREEAEEYIAAYRPVTTE